MQILMMPRWIDSDYANFSLFKGRCLVQRKKMKMVQSCIRTPPAIIETELASSIVFWKKKRANWCAPNPF
jgi:hypothetical protein